MEINPHFRGYTGGMKKLKYRGSLFAGASRGEQHGLSEKPSCRSVKPRITDISASYYHSGDGRVVRYLRNVSWAKICRQGGQGK